MVSKFETTNENDFFSIFYYIFITIDVTISRLILHNNLHLKMSLNP